MILAILRALPETRASSVLAGGALTLLLASACQVRGNGDVSTESRTAEPFASVQTGASVDVEVRVGNAQEVLVECDSNLLEYIETEIREDTLSIEIREGHTLHPNARCRVLAYTRDLASLEANGSGYVLVDGEAVLLRCLSHTGSGTVEIRAPAVADQLSAALFGSGALVVGRVEADALLLHGEGSGDLVVEDGEVGAVEVTARGSGAIDTTAVAASEADVHLTGSGSVHVFASERADVELYGSGSVMVHGQPTERNDVVDGSGSLTYP